MIFFFFSSRRRHTRFDCDWSSDVCSSDLKSLGVTAVEPMPGHEFPINGIYGQELERPNYWGDRKSTRLNSRHSQISHAGLCLKKKKTLIAVLLALIFLLSSLGELLKSVIL